MNHPNRWLSVFCVKQDLPNMRTEKGKEQWKERKKLEKKKIASF